MTEVLQVVLLNNIKAKLQPVRSSRWIGQEVPLIGLLFMMPLAGAALGAASGVLGGKLADLGTTTDKVLAALRGGGTVMRSSFDETREEALREALAGVRAATSEACGRIPAPRSAFWRR